MASRAASWAIERSSQPPVPTSTHPLLVTWAQRPLESAVLLGAGGIAVERADHRGAPNPPPCCSGSNATCRTARSTASRSWRRAGSLRAAPRRTGPHPPGRGAPRHDPRPAARRPDPDRGRRASCSARRSTSSPRCSPRRSDRRRAAASSRSPTPCRRCATPWSTGPRGRSTRCSTDSPRSLELLPGRFDATAVRGFLALPGGPRAVRAQHRGPVARRGLDRRDPCPVGPGRPTSAALGRRGRRRQLVAAPRSTGSSWASHSATTCATQRSPAPRRRPTRPPSYALAPGGVAPDVARGRRPRRSRTGGRGARRPRSRPPAPRRHRSPHRHRLGRGPGRHARRPASPRPASRTGNAPRWMSCSRGWVPRRRPSAATSAPEASTVPLELSRCPPTARAVARGCAARADLGFGSIVVARPSLVQSVPYRVVCVLGLDGDAVPAGRTLGDDLLRHAPMVGDRDAARRGPRRAARGDHGGTRHARRDLQLDRRPHQHQGPRGRRARRARRGRRRHAGHHPRRAPRPRGRHHRVIHRHPRQAFDPANFAAAPGSPPTRFDPVALEGARALQHRDATEATGSSPTRPLPVDAEQVVELADLRCFFRHPVRTFFRPRLDVVVPTRGRARRRAPGLARLASTGRGSAAARRIGLPRCRSDGLRRWPGRRDRTCAPCWMPPAPGVCLPPRLSPQLSSTRSAPRSTSSWTLPRTSACVALRPPPSPSTSPCRRRPAGRHRVGLRRRRRPGPVDVRYSRPKPHRRIQLAIDLFALRRGPDARSPRRARRPCGLGEVPRPTALAWRVRGDGPAERRALAADALEQLVAIRADGLRLPLPLFDGTSFALAEDRGVRDAWGDVSGDHAYKDAADRYHQLAFGALELNELLALSSRWAHPPGRGGPALGNRSRRRWCPTTMNERRGRPVSTPRFQVDDPLPVGHTTLLDASAGTGKTYALTALAVRFVAEHGIPIDSILLVTFTRAATAELRERIRTRLVEAAAHLDPAGVDPREDPLLAPSADARRRPRRASDAARTCRARLRHRDDRHHPRVLLPGPSLARRARGAEPRRHPDPVRGAAHPPGRLGPDVLRGQHRRGGRR